MANSIPKPVQDLIQAFTRLPGIGPKTAQRLAMHLLQSPENMSDSLSGAIKNLKISTMLCRKCWHLTMQSPCAICDDQYREHNVICVVEHPADLIALEKTGTYKGLYHVLHGSLSPIDGIGPDDLKIAELMARAKEPNGGPAIEEVILATNPTMEGEATASYLSGLLKPLGVRTTRIARGLPSGADIEYADDLTLMRAMEGRHEF
ncbi:recombination protein RecR [Candidatus Peregrinibacteria bacterium]|jgi:recombination protein RecR|nr:recombination protein RecR [Candidatus Peregrinibacteria bacterium]MBT7483563.1 recombination protein RecR [Candidatus Peregrinibacteria bacterium]MBT7703345.1 recombination protein RecR [Candidatus Peregrinibacteria bacterium]